MAKTMKRPPQAALRRRLGPKPVKSINIGTLIGIVCS